MNNTPFLSPQQAAGWFTRLSTPLEPEGPQHAVSPASDSMHESGMDAHSGTVTINGVQLPAEVVRQLSMGLGDVPAAWLTAAQLREALNSYRDDGTVFDDPHGHDFHDRLKLTSQEAALRSPDRSQLTVSAPSLDTSENLTFAERLELERSQGNVVGGPG